jgi:hypothetical protein
MPGRRHRIITNSSSISTRVAVGDRDLLCGAKPRAIEPQCQGLRLDLARNGRHYPCLFRGCRRFSTVAQRAGKPAPRLAVQIVIATGAVAQVHPRTTPFRLMDRLRHRPTMTGGRLLPPARVHRNVRLAFHAPTFRLRPVQRHARYGGKPGCHAGSRWDRFCSY